MDPEVDIENDVDAAALDEIGPDGIRVPERSNKQSDLERDPLFDLSIRYDDFSTEKVLDQLEQRGLVEREETTVRERNPEITVVAAATEGENGSKLERAGANAVVSPAAIGGRRLVESALGGE